MRDDVLHMALHMNTVGAIWWSVDVVLQFCNMSAELHV